MTDRSSFGPNPPNSTPHHQAERTLFDAIYLVPLQRKDYRSYEKETLCKLMGSAIGFDDASNEREIVFLLQVRACVIACVRVCLGRNRPTPRPRPSLYP